MSDAGDAEVTAERPRRGRWMRRELWFAVLAVLAILIVTWVAPHMKPTHTAPGRAVGALPNSRVPGITAPPAR